MARDWSPPGPVTESWHMQAPGYLCRCCTVGTTLACSAACPASAQDVEEARARLDNLLAEATHMGRLLDDLHKQKARSTLLLTLFPAYP